MLLAKILIELNQEELELLIEVMERNRHENDKESALRHDLRKIRLQFEQKIEEREKEIKSRPNEEMRKIPNPTSAEHIK